MRSGTPIQRAIWQGLKAIEQDMGTTFEWKDDSYVAHRGSIKDSGNGKTTTLKIRTELFESQRPSVGDKILCEGDEYQIHQAITDSPDAILELKLKSTV